MEFVAIKPGWFWMGSEEGGPAERPRHRVWVDGFAIARTPVTREAFAAYLADSGAGWPAGWAEARFGAPDQPVVGVSWLAASAFCAWLTARTGRRHRLPWEAEWERAARGGLADARYPWGDQPPERLGLDPAGPRPAPPPVGRGPANAYGLADLSGVVHEWCQDWFDEGYYAASPSWNPRGPAAGVRRVSRGGAWRHQRPWSPVAHRSSLPPHLGHTDYGFRVIRE